MNFHYYIIALLILVFAGSAPAASVPQDKETISFKTKTGIVTFHHKKHSELSFVKCATCHHTWEGKGKVKACRECHRKSDDIMAPKRKTALHTRCQGCHEYSVSQGRKAGPQPKECKLCHIK